MSGFPADLCRRRLLLSGRGVGQAVAGKNVAVVATDRLAATMVRGRTRGVTAEHTGRVRRGIPIPERLECQRRRGTLAKNAGA